MQFVKSLQIVHEFVLMSQAMKIPSAKAVVGKECEKLEKLPTWQLTKVKSEKEDILEKHTKIKEQSILLR